VAVITYVTAIVAALVAAALLMAGPAYVLT
jgi:hypothetical protein